MFQLEWANKKSGSDDTPVAARLSKVNRRAVDKLLVTRWEEHCVECAIPECYAACPLYERRMDGACARFVHGIVPNDAFKGHFDFGADIVFRKWGKLEACLTDSFASPVLGNKWLNMYQRLPDFLKSFVRAGCNAVYLKKNDLDEFVLECYSPQKESFKLLLEYFTEQDRVRNTKFRHFFMIQPGYNLHRVPFEAFGISKLEGYIYLYPENSAPQKRLIFTWLDFLKYQRKPSLPPVMPPRDPAKKIKCVAWDLDNTLWQGTLVEDEAVNPNAEAVRLVRELDARGILQTIISKNNFDEAWPKVVKAGISDYFLYPAINWGQKSVNLSEIARRLNIDLDTFAVIDDSPFEREEISKSLPQVRVYSEKEISKVIAYEEFDVPATDLSKVRRISYLTEEKRNEVKASFAGSYEDFIASCNMVLEVFSPHSEAEVLRCYELVQRSNQLNLSSRRYTLPEFKALLGNNHFLSVSFKCRDKFGDYGIVGFSSINFHSPTPVIEDFVLSCRVAQKRVEHTFLKGLAGFLAQRGYSELDAKLVPTAKNKPLRQVFSDLPFTLLHSGQDLMHLRLDLGTRIGLSDVIDLRFDASVFIPLNQAPPQLSAN